MESHRKSGQPINKPFFIFISIVLALVIVVLAIYQYTLHMPAASKSSDEISIETARTTLSAIIEKLQPVTQKYQIQPFNIMTPSAVSQYDTDLGFFVAIPGASLTIKADKPADASAVSKATITTVDQYIKSNNFVTYLDHSAEGGAYLKAFGSDKVVCTVSGPETGDTMIACSAQDSLDKISGDLKVLATAYFAANPNIDKSSTIVSEPDIKNLANGYANASMNVSYIMGGGWATLFYHTPGSSWVYWRGTQSILDCKEYNTNTLRTAFSGESCASYNDSGEMITTKVGQ